MALDDKLICLFGGGGFLGRYIGQKLLARGARVRVAERRVKNAMHLKPLGNLGQTQFASADVTKPDSVARAVLGCDAVANLVGILDGDFDAIHVRGARTVAEKAREGGSAAFIQMSAIGADPKSPSRYGRSKGEGEVAVREAFPDTTILRPSVVFGREDEFVNRFAGLIAAFPVIPVIGPNAKFQPVFVGDVADAVVAALDEPRTHAGRTYELGGPEVMTMMELNRRIARLVRRDRTFLPVPDAMAKLTARMGFLPGAPITMDQYKMLQRDNVVAADALGLDALGVAPTPLAVEAPGWMDRYTPHGRFGAGAKAGLVK